MAIRAPSELTIEAILLGGVSVFRSGFVFVSKSLDPPEVRASPGLQKHKLMMKKSHGQGN